MAIEKRYYRMPAIGTGVKEDEYRPKHADTSGVEAFVAIRDGDPPTEFVCQITADTTVHDTITADTDVTTQTLNQTKTTASGWGVNLEDVFKNFEVA